MISRDTIRQLVDSDNPVEALWMVLLNIWTRGAREFLKERKAVKDYYIYCENESDYVERVLFKIFFDIYDYLLNETKQHKQLLSKFPKEIQTAIFMDSMSIREAVPIIKELENEGYIVEEFTYALSASPSDTDIYRMKIWGVKGFEELRKCKFGFKAELVSKESAIENLESTSEPLLIWCVFPDDLLQKSSLDYESVYQKTKEVLLKILGVIHPERAVIGSDHGYVADIGTWGVPSEHVRFFQRVFKTERFKKISDIEPEHLKWIHGLPKVSSYFVLDDQYVYVRGRHMWTTKGRRPVSFHGGISFTEVLTPLLIVKKG